MALNRIVVLSTIGAQAGSGGSSVKLEGSQGRCWKMQEKVRPKIISCFPNTSLKSSRKSGETQIFKPRGFNVGSFFGVDFKSGSYASLEDEVTAYARKRPPSQPLKVSVVRAGETWRNQRLTLEKSSMDEKSQAPNFLQTWQVDPVPEKSPFLFTKELTERPGRVEVSLTEAGDQLVDQAGMTDMKSNP